MSDTGDLQAYDATLQNGDARLGAMVPFNKQSLSFLSTRTSIGLTQQDEGNRGTRVLLVMLNL